MATKAKPTLTPKQKRFVAEYLVDLNATQAAIRAGYAPRSAKQEGHKQLQRPEMRAAVAAALEQQAERTLVSADQVLLNIQRAGLKSEALLDFHAALRAWELIGKRYKLFTDKVEVTNNTPRAERLREARARRQKA